MKTRSCMQCGKPLVVTPDPKKPNQSEKLLGHYFIGDQMVCVECHEEKTTAAKRENRPKTTGDKVFHVKFGNGTIVKRWGQKVFMVDFENHVTKNIQHDFLTLI